MLESVFIDYKVKGYIFFVLFDNEYDFLNIRGKNLFVELFVGNVGENNKIGFGIRVNG